MKHQEAETVCEYCGPKCYRGAEHNARVEDNARYTDVPAPVPDTPGAIPLPDVLRRLRMAVNEPADSFGDAYGWVEFLRTEILAAIRALATQGKQETNG